MEVWRAVCGYEGHYSVSDCGRVRSDRRITNSRVGMVLSPTFAGDGYHAVRLSKDGVQRKFYVHSLVYRAFVGEVAHGLEINHKNGDKTDNRISNLEAITHLDNVRHAISVLGMSRKGEDSPNAKLTERQVLEIRELCSSGKRHGDVAIRFGIHPEHVGRIHRRERWTHI